MIAHCSPLGNGHWNWNPPLWLDPINQLFSRFGRMVSLEAKTSDFAFKSIELIEQFLGVYSFAELPHDNRGLLLGAGKWLNSTWR